MKNVIAFLFVVVAVLSTMGCVTAPQTTTRRVYVSEGARTGGTHQIAAASRRGQAAAMYAGYREQTPGAHSQALDMDQADLKWRRNDQDNDRENRRQTQDELDGEVRREVALRRQTVSEKREDWRQTQGFSREAQSWVRLMRRR